MERKTALRTKPGPLPHPRPSLQEQLCQLYPRLKVLAFGAKPESTLHIYFPSFLSRATPNCPPAMKKEVRKWQEAPFSLPGVSCGGPCLLTKAQPSVTVFPEHPSAHSQQPPTPLHRVLPFEEQS